ncbi:MAG TPA: L-lactate permease [Anaerolineales bacterium]|nr:L-lactate permease [Anaerolineales bacterium]
MGNFLLALLPIVIILYLMVVNRWGAARAGSAGYLSAMAVAIIFFGATPELLAYAHSKALMLALDVLLIIWAAFLLYRVADEAGAIRTIGLALPHLTPDRGMQAIIIGWVFASFLQGVGGFGVPVAVIAPILVGLGFPPLSAVVIPSIGHGWAVTFGSMGSSFQALLAATNQPEALLAPPSALFLGISGVFVGLMVAHAADGWPAVKRLLFPILILGVVMGTVQYLVAVYGTWNIAAFIAGLFGLIVGFPLAYRNQKQKNSTNGELDWKSLLVAISGYAILILITLGIQLIPAIHQFLGQVSLQIDFPEIRSSLGYITPAGTSRKIVIFRHTGVILFYASVIAYLVYHKAGLYKSGSVKRILDGTLRKVMSSSVSILSMISMAVIMEHVGMTESLARGLAEGVGSLFPLASPWIGALGAFMTGSNTNSNVVFGGLQLRTAEILGYSVPIILAAQTAGAALASVMAPTKVVVGASTAGMAGKEGEVMRHLLKYTGLLVFLISLLAMAAIWL